MYTHENTDIDYISVQSNIKKILCESEKKQDTLLMSITS